jgi:uncharacterized membrane-anchored protein YhcB (DUF1043 family)
MARSPNSWLAFLDRLVIPGLIAAVWIGTSAWNAHDTLATNRYVDEKSQAQKQYTDAQIETTKKDIEVLRKETAEHFESSSRETADRYAQVAKDIETMRREVVSHSDDNRKDLTLMWTQSNAQTRETLATVATKLETLTSAFEQFVAKPHPVKK